MERLYVEGQKHTPEVCLDPSANEYYIRGRSYPENSSKFYDPIKEWLINYNHEQGYTITFQFDYLSSSSVVAILSMLREIEDKSTEGKRISILWIYDEDDDDLRRTGEDLMKFLSLDVSIQSEEVNLDS